jgi:hypothetical protein
LWSRKLAELSVASYFSELAKSSEPKPGKETEAAAVSSAASKAAEEASEDALREIDPYADTVVRLILAATTIGRGPDFDGPSDQFAAYDEILMEWLDSKESELATKLSTRFRFLHERVRALQDHAALDTDSYALIGQSLCDCFEDRSEIGSAEFNLLTTKMTFWMRAFGPILNKPELAVFQNPRRQSAATDAPASVPEKAEGARPHHQLARIWISFVKKCRDVWASNAW